MLRLICDQGWKRFHLGNVAWNALLMLGFEWGVAVQHLEIGRIIKGRDDREATRERVRLATTKTGRQLIKDYVAFPTLTSLSPGDLQVDRYGQCDGQRDPQHLVQRGHLLRPFSQRRKIHQA
jgi:fatty acid desaturase